MRSLRAHLRQPEHHARLPFHPDCPVCRSERLAGVLPSDRLISRPVSVFRLSFFPGIERFSIVLPLIVSAA